MQKIKILHILYSGQGGLGTYFMNFVNSDQKKQFEHFAFFYGVEELNPELEAFCKEQQIPYRYQRKQTKIDFKALGKVLEFRKQNQIQYLLLHTFSLSLLTILGLIRNWKVIAFDHTTLAYKTKIEKIFTLVNHLFAPKMIYFYDGHFEQNKRQFPFLRFGKNSHIIPKTVDIHFFKPAQKKPDHPNFTFGITARLIQGKRHDLSIEAIRALKEKGEVVHLKIAGKGPKTEEIKAMVTNYQLHEEIEFVGLLNRNQLLHFYQSLDAYIHASEGETICYSIMEAQACGLPILASDVEGISNYLQEGKEAVLFENKTEHIEKAILKMINEANLVEFGNFARNQAEVLFKKYNNPDMLKNLLT
jgi:glycosyltransferase involved in cell wall biosynthesis